MPKGDDEEEEGLIASQSPAAMVAFAAQQNTISNDENSCAHTSVGRGHRTGRAGEGEALFKHASALRLSQTSVSPLSDWLRRAAVRLLEAGRHLYKRARCGRRLH